MAALTYRDILERYDRARAFGGETRSLQEYAADLNKRFGNEDYSAGLRDGNWTRFSTRVDQALSPLGNAAAVPMGALGEAFGSREVGEEVGRGLPRALVNMIPMFATGGATALPTVAAGIAGTAGLMGAHTYAETGDPTQAAISTALGAITPGAAKVGEKLALAAVGAPEITGVLKATIPGFGKTGDFVSKRVATTVGEKAAGYIGSQLGMGVVSAAGATAQGEDPLSKEWATSFLLNQIPFTAHDIMRMGGAPKTSEAEWRSLVEAKAPETKAPNVYVPQAGSEENQKKVLDILEKAKETEAERTARLQAEKAVNKIMADPKLSQEEKLRQVELVKNPLQQELGLDGTGKVAEKTNTPVDQAPVARTAEVIQGEIDATMKNDQLDPIALTEKLTRLHAELAALPKVEPVVDQAPAPEPAPEPTPAPEYVSSHVADVVPKLEALSIAGVPKEQLPFLARVHELVTEAPLEEQYRTLTQAIADVKGEEVASPETAQAAEDMILALGGQKRKVETVPEEFLMEDGQPLDLEHATPARFDLRDYAVNETSAKHGGTDFGDGVYLDTVAGGWRNHVADVSNTPEENLNILKARVKGGLKVFRQEEAYRPEFAQQVKDADVVIDLFDGKISQVFVKDPKNLIPTVTELGENYLTPAEQETQTQLDDTSKSVIKAKEVETVAAAGATAPQVEQFTMSLAECEAAIKKALEKASKKQKEKERSQKRRDAVKAKTGKTKEQQQRQEEIELGQIFYTKLGELVDDIKAARVKKIEDVSETLTDSKAKDELARAVMETEIPHETVLKAFEAALKEGQKNGNDNIQDQLFVVLARTLNMQRSKMSPEEVGAVVKALRKAGGRTPAGSTGPLMPGQPQVGDVTGFQNRQEAQVFLDQRLKDGEKGSWRIVETKKGSGIWAVKEYRRDLSLDKSSATDENGKEAGLYDQIADPEGLNQTKVEGEVTAASEIGMGQVVVDRLYKLLDAANKHLMEFGEAAGNLDGPMANLTLLRQAKAYLGYMKETGKLPTATEVNKRLAKPEEHFTDDAQMLRTFERIRRGLNKVDDRILRESFMLGSEGPVDRKLVREIGIVRGGWKAWLDWFMRGNESDPTAILLKDALAMFDHSGVKTTFEKGLGFYYDVAEQAVNIGTLPKDVAHATELARTVAHEVIHHATRELMNRTDASAVKFRASLKEIMHMVYTSKEMPDSVRRAITKMKDNGVMQLWQDAQADRKAVFDTWVKYVGNRKTAEKWLGVAYGMHSPVEFVSQVFGSKHLLDILSRTRGTRPTERNLLHGFVNAVARLFGFESPIHQTALEQLMTGFDHFVNGKVIDGYTPKQYFRDSMIMKGTPLKNLATAVESATRFAKTGDLQHVLDAFSYFQDRDGRPALDPFLATDLTTGEPKDVRGSVENLIALREDLSSSLDTVSDLRDFMEKQVSAAEEYLEEVRKERMPDEGVTKEAKLKVKQARANLNAMREGMAKQLASLDKLSLTDLFADGETQLSVFSDVAKGSKLAMPDGPPEDVKGLRRLMGLDESELLRADRSTAEVRKASSQEALESTGDKKGWMEKTFLMTQFMKKQFPVLRPLIDHVRNSMGDATDRMSALNLAFGENPATHRVDNAILESNKRVQTTEGLWKAVSEIALYAQEQIKAGNQFDMADKFVQGVLRTLSDTKVGKNRLSDREAVKQWIRSNAERHGAFTQVIMPRFFTRYNSNLTARIVAAREAGMLPDSARQVAQNLYEALAQPAGPGQSEMLQIVSKQVSPETFLKIYSHATALVKATNKFLEFMQKNPFYISEKRYDKYHIRMTKPDGSTFYWSAKTKEDLLRVQREKEGQGYKTVYSVDKADYESAHLVDKEVLSAMEEMDKLHMVQMESALEGMPEEVIQRVTSLLGNRTSEYSAAAESFKPTPGVTRKLVAGRELMNMTEQAHEFYIRANNWMRHKEVRSETALDMMHPELAGNAGLLKYARQHVENFLTPDNQIARKAVEATYFMKLGFDLGNSMIEGMQNLTTGMQALISETASVTDATRLWKSSLADMHGFWKTGKWSDSNIQWFMERASSRGDREQTLWDEAHDPGTEQVLNANLAANAGPLKKAVGMVHTAARRWSNKFQRYNNDIGLLSGFKLAMEKGMGLEEAYNFAVDMKERGYFTGGKAQRAVGLWSIKTKAVPQILSALQTYNLGWFGQMYADYQIGFGRNKPEGLTPQQIAGSRKAFIYGLAAQAALAGALGMPGVGQGIALLQQSTGFDLKGELKQTLAKMFGEDEASGGLVTSLALRGVLAGVSPLDPSNRISASFPFIGIDAYKGFSPDKLMGAPVSTAVDAAQGFLALLGGDPAGVEKLMPNVLRRPARLLMDEGDVRDARGALIQRLTPFQQIATIAGLSPSSVQAAKDNAEIIRKKEDKLRKETAADYDRLAKVYRKQGEAAGQAALVEYLKANPDKDPRQVVTAVSARFKAQTEEQNPALTANPALDLRGLTTEKPATLSSGRALQNRYKADMGLRVKSNARADSVLELADALMASGQATTGSEARRVAEEMLRGPRRRNVLDIPGLQ